MAKIKPRTWIKSKTGEVSHIVVMQSTASKVRTACGMILRIKDITKVNPKDIETKCSNCARTGFHLLPRSQVCKCCGHGLKGST